MALVNNLDEAECGREFSLRDFTDDSASGINLNSNDALQAELDFKRMFNALEDGIFNLNLNLDEEKKFNLENSKLNQFFASNLQSNAKGNIDSAASVQSDQSPPNANGASTSSLSVQDALTTAVSNGCLPFSLSLDGNVQTYRPDSNVLSSQFLTTSELLPTRLNPAANSTTGDLGLLSSMEQFQTAQHKSQSIHAPSMTQQQQPAHSQSYSEPISDVCAQQSYELARLANEFKEKFDDVHTAINYYTKAIQLNGVEFRFYYNRSICLQQANMLVEALDDANAAIQLVPNARKPYLRKAEILVQMNKFSDAEQVLIECINLSNAIDLPVELVQEELRKMIRATLIKFGFPEQVIETATQCKSIEQAMDFAFNRQLEAKLNVNNVFPRPRSFTNSHLTNEQVMKLGPISKSLDSQDTIDYFTDEEALNGTSNRKFSFNEEQLYNYAIGSPVKKNGFVFQEQQQANKHHHFHHHQQQQQQHMISNNQLMSYQSNHMMSGNFGASALDGATASGTTGLSQLAMENNQAIMHPSLMNKLNHGIVRKRSSLSLSEPIDHFVKSFSFDPFMKHSLNDHQNKSELNFSMMSSNLYSKSLGSSYSNLAHYMQNLHSNENSQGEEVQVDPKYKELIERNNRCTNLIGYKGLWLGNISSNCSRERLISIFRKYGDPIVHQLKKSPCVFIKYNNEKSPTDAIQDLHGKIIVDIVHNKNDPLRLHFECNRRQQEENFPKNKMIRNFKNGECYFWRTVGCPNGVNCPKIHVPINEKIDFQMWMLNDPNHKI